MKNIIWALAAVTVLAACQTNTEKESSPETKMENTTEAPKAKMVAHEMSIHGDTRVDNYFWMRLSDEQKKSETPDQQTQDVVDYLNAENTYREGEMKDTEEFQEILFDEIVGRIKQTDESVPTKVNGYWYYTRYEEGKEYPIFCRKEGTMEAEEEIMLNVPEMAEGFEYYQVGGRSVSPNNEMIVYGVDTVSRREYTLSVKNLKTGEIYEDQIPKTTGGATWANDNKTLFYTKKDPVTLRSFQIYKHKLGTDSSEDQLVYEESDETFSCFVYKTKSRDFLVVGSVATESAEYQFLDANNPDGEFQMIQPRVDGLEYSLAHYGSDFYIVTNKDEAQNFKLVKAPVTSPGMDNWQEVIPHREDVLLESIEIFKDYLVIEERKNGLTEIHIKKWDGTEDYYMEFQDPAYTAYTGYNPEFDTKVMRYGYSSMTTPNSTYDYNLESKDRELLKQQEVMDPQFSPDNYTSERLMAKATDGTLVPISLVYKKGVEKNGENPLLLYGYGSYGASMDPYFSSVRLSLLDRGFVYAIAHIRGGQEMGRHWYEDGKKLNKMNTFTDFVDCADFLIGEGYTNPDHLYAMGGSAGGLLMGAVVNMRPELWNGVVAAVPFVDVVSTMLDETIPLTTGEFDEWGNPKDEEYYHYIKGYSPYDNVVAKDYPNMLITTGYWDSQVQYWEPAKWTAKLRELKTDNNQLYLYCNMDTGHGGASGRFKRFRETAMEYAFILRLEGIDS
ncbi:MAG: S9 family peptidase [Flavobacteriales bacterium]|nr:S9 family peptidase [Flavobacteriales bacterium]